MTDRRSNAFGKDARISRQELDRLFDRELDSNERRDLVGRLGRDPIALDEVTDVRRMVHSMRIGPDETPDLTSAVMDRLDRSTGFLSPRLRRRVKLGRLSAAACLLVGLLGVAIAQRTAPEWFRTTEFATPVADLSAAVRQDSVESRDRLSQAVTKLAASESVQFQAVANPASALAGAMSSGIMVPGRVDEVRTTRVGMRTALDMPSRVPARYLTLSASADAEALALNTDGAHGLSFVSGPAHGQVPAESFALTSFPMSVMSVETRVSIGDSRAMGNKATEIQAGVIPLGFRNVDRSAYVGKRYVLPPAIIHNAEHGVSRLSDRPR